MENCKEMVDVYERSLAIEIIGVRRLGLEISYAVMFKDASVVMHGSSDVRTKWPDLLQTFLFKRIEWTNRINVAQDLQMNETKTVTVLELDPPTAILGKFHFFAYNFDYVGS